MIYAVLFFPGLNYGAAPAASFSVIRELSRVLGYNIPSLLLIWYLSYLKNRFWRPLPRPGRGDLISLGIALPSLVLAGFLVSLVSSLFSDTAAIPLPGTPRGGLQWLAVVLSCLSTGYLEETFFRAYFLTRLEDAGIPLPAGLILSVLLFSLCHIYEGPWGVMNALLAGLLLSLVFLRRRAVHGIAWAHGLYNIFVYLWLGAAGA